MTREEANDLKLILRTLAEPISPKDDNDVVVKNVMRNLTLDLAIDAITSYAEGMYNETLPLLRKQDESNGK